MNEHIKLHIKHKLSSNTRLVSKRCTARYLSTIGLLDQVETIAPADFHDLHDKIRYIVYGGGYCLVCGVRTNTDVTGKGFAKYCKDHFHTPKKGKPAHNKKQVDAELLRKLYVDDQRSLVSISEELGVSNVTLQKHLTANNIKQRSHSENQSICSTVKGKRVADYPTEWWDEQYAAKSTEAIAYEIGCSSTTVLNMLKEHNIVADRHLKLSKQEVKLYELLADMGIDFEPQNKTILKPHHLDAYIPEHKLAIEINGIYWHSDRKGKDASYHLHKTNECNKLNINLLHFWDKEIDERIHIVRSMIASKLNLTTKIHARKCSVADIDQELAARFFDDNHMQGHQPAQVYKGLYFGGELVAAVSLGKPRYNKKYKWELIRFANKLDTTVVGGLSKLLKSFEGSIISYANRRWSVGNVYERLGFKLTGSTAPNYFYTKDFTNLYSRIRFQKHKLKNLPYYDDKLTESDIMKLNGYYRVWDCGQLVYVLHK